MKSILRFFVLISAFIPLQVLNGADIKFKVSDIPENLLKDAKAVVRISEIEFKINSTDKAVTKIHYALTILNENGIDESVFLQFYDKFSSIRNIKVDLYDKNGERIKNWSNIDIKDYSAISGYSIYEDTRVKYVDPKYRTTPFTVEYSYEVVYDGLFNYPGWSIYFDYNISIEKSSFKVIAPSGFKFRYKEQFLTDKCSISNYPDQDEYKWEIKNCPAFRKELFSLHLSEYTPALYLAPNDFEIGDSKGNCESWLNFGLWMNKLGEGRNILPDATKAELLNIIKDCDTDYAKISKLYAYLQNKVRYVSIQIGLGGWQTIKAETVDRLSYGDCKALSNYMKSLLDVAGIKSLYTLVRAGENAPSLRKDFPSNQFNHAILCIPQGIDTLWLECTSQHIPFGFIGSFTDDRNVIVTDESGGHVVRTKQYTISDNQKIRNIVLKLNNNGSGESFVLTRYKGIEYDNMSSVLVIDEADKKEYIQKNIQIPNFNLTSYSYNEDRKLIPTLEEHLKLSLPGYATLSGQRIFFNPNLMTRFGKVPSRTQERHSTINIRRSFLECDSVSIILPDNFKADILPDNKSISCKFGEYNSKIVPQGSNLLYIRTFKMFKGIFPVSDYREFVDFCEKVSLADEQKLSISKTIL